MALIARLLFGWAMPGKSWDQVLVRVVLAVAVFAFVVFSFAPSHTRYWRTQDQIQKDTDEVQEYCGAVMERVGTKPSGRTGLVLDDLRECTERWYSLRHRWSELEPPAGYKRYHQAEMEFYEQSARAMRLTEEAVLEADPLVFEDAMEAMERAGAAAHWAQLEIESLPGR